MYKQHMQAWAVFALLFWHAFQQERQPCPSCVLGPGPDTVPCPAVSQRSAECWVLSPGEGWGAHIRKSFSPAQLSYSGGWVPQVLQETLACVPG